MGIHNNPYIKMFYKNLLNRNIFGHTSFVST